LLVFFPWRDTKTLFLLVSTYFLVGSAPISTSTHTRVVDGRRHTKAVFLHVSTRLSRFNVPLVLQISWFHTREPNEKMTDSASPWLYVLLLALAELGGIYSLKKASSLPPGSPGKTPYLVLGAAFYGLAVPFFLYRSLQVAELGPVNLAWNVFSTIAAYLIGVYLFRDTMPSLTKCAGVLLALTGMALVLVGR
jgi:multidrug transporter EmrE-like cation transporter